MSSSAFHLVTKYNVMEMSGSITASKALIGKPAGPKVSFDGTNIVIDTPNFDVTSGGSVSMAGTITATAGTIGGFNIGSDLDSSGGTLKLKGTTGQITASAAQISGKVTATSGQIAGWKIVGNVLSGSNATLDAAGAALFKSDQGPDTDGTLSLIHI